MNIGDLKLGKFTNYKQKNIDYEEFYLFYIVYDVKNNKVLESKEKIIGSEFQEIEFLREIKTEDFLKKRIKLFYIPKTKEYKKDYKILRKIWFDIQYDLQKEKKNFLEFFNGYYLSISISFIVLLYSSYFSYALVDIGVPIQTIKVGFPELLFVIGYTFISIFISILFSIILYLIIVFIVLYIIFMLVAFLKQKIFYIRDVIYKTKEFLLYVMIATFGIFYAILVFIPIAHIFWDELKINSYREDKFQPDFLYQEYLKVTGYPKIIYRKNTQYLFVGHDGVYEYMYDVSEVKAYIVKQDNNESKKAYEQFCRNIAVNSKYSNILYEFMRNSPSLVPHKAKLSYITNKYKYKSLDMIDINSTKMKKDCKLFLHVKEINDILE